MKAFRIKTDKVVHPFDEAARDLYVATKPVRQWQEDACTACGLNLIEIHDLTQLPDEPDWKIMQGKVSRTQSSNAQPQRQLQLRPMR